jgi:tetratricopeptide (TPR) repeat protein
MQENPVDAFQRARALATSQPTNPTHQFNLGWWASRLGDTDTALSAYRRALDLQVSAPEEVWLNISSVYSEQLGDSKQALNALSKALSIKPDYIDALFNRGHVAEQCGDHSLAVESFSRVLQLAPRHAAALARLADTIEAGSDPAVVQRLRAATAAEKPDVDQLFALARHEEAAGETEAAWARWVQANALDARAQQQTLPLETVRAACRQASQATLPPLHDATHGPVFICGMFRTGSTLLEQMLAAHPRFAPLGESDFWPRRVAAARGGMIHPAGIPKPEVLAHWAEVYRAHAAERVEPSLRFTDKRPDNIYQLHLIAAALPNARFVVTERDWRDVVLSVFATRLHPQHSYATDPQQIREQLRLLNELTESWLARYSERVYRLRYESLVANPRATLGDLLEWLGESWSDECLQFHQLNNSVRTASVWQVRKPLSADRQQRWRRFEGPLRDIFGDDLDRDSP